MSVDDFSMLSRLIATYRIVRHEVMHIVTALPPANGEPGAEVSDEDTNQRVDDEVVGDASVSCIVGSKHDLMPPQAEESCCGRITFAVEEE